MVELYGSEVESGLGEKADQGPGRGLFAGAHVSRSQPSPSGYLMIPV